jgi:acetyl-CoA acetyltransferase
MPTTIKDECAIVGIGQTEFSENSGRSELQLAVECVKAAVEDAGLALSDIDGMVTFFTDGSDEIAVMRGFGSEELKFFSRMPHGSGSAIALVHQAVMAVASGMCQAVTGYRALNGSSGPHFNPGAPGGPLSTDQIHWSWYMPYGLMTPASWMAMFTQRYMHQYGATDESLAEIAVTARKHAANNPDAFFYERPLTLEDYYDSDWITAPLRLSDCYTDTDGGSAFVVTSAERARDLAHPPALVRGVSQGASYDQEVMTSFYRKDISYMPECDMVADQCYEQSGLGSDDIDAAVIFDTFTSNVLFQLESFRFCKRGEAHEFVKGGTLGLDGRLPFNTSGGQLGEAYVEGVNGINEGVRLIRGASSNQPKKSDHVLVTSGGCGPTSAMILGKSK